MAQYLPVAALLVLAFLFALISLIASKILAPNRATEAKYAPYECGIIPGREPPQRFPVRFYLVAMLFIVFDIEIIFLYPYAMVHSELGLYGLVAILLFSALVFESFLYLISKGALDWGPLQVNRRQPEAVGAQRTSTSTVRRVGLEGRYEQSFTAGPGRESLIEPERVLVDTTMVDGSDPERTLETTGGS